MSGEQLTIPQYFVRFLLGALVVFFVLPCLGFVLPVEFLFYAAFGWIAFLARVAPEIRPDWSAIAFCVLAIAIFGGGLHWFLGWLYAAVSWARRPNHEGNQPVSSTAAWSAGWTVAIVALTLTFFVAGISMVGLTHQFAWLATSKEPIVGSSFSAYRQPQSANNLRNIGLAVQAYDNTYNRLPSGTLFGPEGQALHGWQTLILPYIEQQTIFGQIDLRLPWNADTQRAPFSTRISLYRISHHELPDHDSAGYALTHYAANQHLIGAFKTRGFVKIKDGASSTILAGEAAGNYKPWGNPTNWRDPAAGINTSPNGFGSPWRGAGAQFVFADGHTALLSDKIDPKVLRALATPSGNEPIPNDY